MDTSPRLTLLESRVLSTIDEHIAVYGHSPTFAEIALQLRLKSKGTVHRYVQALIEKGYLERQGAGWRALRVCTPVASLATLPHSGATSTVQELTLVSDDVDSDLATGAATSDPVIPLLGRIAAGQPIEAIEDQTQINLANYFLGPERYALRVSGDSMIDAGILDGDTVVVRKTSHVRTGDIVVALIDGLEATLKRLGKCENGLVALIPENKTMSTLHYASERVSFQGVLVGQFRSYV